jgi:type IV secretory pathway TrbD component
VCACVAVCVVVCVVYNVGCCVWLLAFSGIVIRLAVAAAGPLAVSVAYRFKHYKQKVYKGWFRRVKRGKNGL